LPRELGGDFRAKPINSMGWRRGRGSRFLIHAFGKRLADLVPITPLVPFGCLKQVFKLIFCRLPMTRNAKVQSVHDSPLVGIRRGENGWGWEASSTGLIVVPFACPIAVPKNGVLESLKRRKLLSFIVVALDESSPEKAAVYPWSR
jgi:hypothetical protein